MGQHSWRDRLNALMLQWTVYLSSVVEPLNASLKELNRPPSLRDSGRQSTLSGCYTKYGEKAEWTYLYRETEEYFLDDM